MKKYIVAGFFVVTFIAYLMFINKNSSVVAVAPSEMRRTVMSTGIMTTNISSGQYKDGTYTGSVADAIYGKLQVTAKIQGGLITDITFPQAPSGGHSSEVSAFALPALKQEAIATQNANVNIVSGATQDSDAFQQSLGDALTQAKA